jgi:hypothetical protein
MREILSSLLFIILPFTWMAHAEIDLSALTYAGTGCAAGGSGIRAKMSAHADRLTVYTPDMSVDLESGGASRLVCSLALPVNVAADEQVVIGRPSVFGKQNLSKGESLHTTAEVFFAAGGAGPQALIDVQGTGSQKLRSFYSRDEESIALPCGQRDLV